MKPLHKPLPAKKRRRLRYCEICGISLSSRLWSTRKNPKEMLCKSCGTKKRMREYHQQKKQPPK
jgi:ribosomal protein L37E